MRYTRRVTLTVRMTEPLQEFPPGQPIRLTLQRKEEHIQAENGEFHVGLNLTERGWRGPEVVWHNDKRAFIYLAWLRESPNGWVRFARIKLYLDQLPDLRPDRDLIVTVQTINAKGEPACSTAMLVL